MVYICILTHNAARYVWTTLDSLSKHVQRNQDRIETFISVLDNDSRWKTRAALVVLKLMGKIDKLQFSPVNLLFAGGNNRLVETLPKSASCEEDFVLLLNSDVEILSDEWLSNLAARMESHVGAVSYGACLDDPVRADGYCILIRRKLYENHPMDESYQWFYSMTKLEAEILKDGYDIIAIDEHESMIHHFGGKSGTDYQGAKGMDTDRKKIISWFTEAGCPGKVIIEESI